MAIEVEKKEANFRVIVRDEDTEVSKSFPIYSDSNLDLDYLLNSLKLCVKDLAKNNSMNAA